MTDKITQIRAALAAKPDARRVDLPREAVEALVAELDMCHAVLAMIDASLPVADETCAEPGITISEAARRIIKEKAA